MGSIEKVCHLCGYREPKNANGSKARYFFAILQRYANKAS